MKCEDCRYFRFEGYQKTCIYEIIVNNGNQELIDERGFCENYTRKLPLVKEKK